MNPLDPRQLHEARRLAGFGPAQPLVAEPRPAPLPLQEERSADPTATTVASLLESSRHAGALLAEKGARPGLESEAYDRIREHVDTAIRLLRHLDGLAQTGRVAGAGAQRTLQDAGSELQQAALWVGTAHRLSRNGS